MDAEHRYAELVEAARQDDNVVGLVLTGSRGSRFGVTDESDWDVRLVVRDEVRDGYRARLGTPHGSAVEVVVLTLDELAAVSELGSPTTAASGHSTSCSASSSSSGRSTATYGLRPLSSSGSRRSSPPATSPSSSSSSATWRSSRAPTASAT
jgi:hypothetical protein